MSPLLRHPCFHFEGLPLRVALWTALLFLPAPMLAQGVDSESWTSSSAPSIRQPAQGVSASGFCRVLGYVRNQNEVFPGNSGKTMAVLVGDLYREPMFLTRLKITTEEGVRLGWISWAIRCSKGQRWTLPH